MIHSDTYGFDVLSSEKTSLLVVEDDPDFQEIISLYLTGNSTSAKLRIVDTLAEAFDLLAKEHFDAVLLDLTLPDSHGFKTFQRSSDRVPEIPIVVISNEDDLDVVTKCLSQGAQDYVSKGNLTAPPLDQVIHFAITRWASGAGRSRTEGRLF